MALTIPRARLGRVRRGRDGERELMLSQETLLCISDPMACFTLEPDNCDMTCSFRLLAQLIQQVYAPQNHLTPEDQRRLQQELFEVQRSPEAWGLILPFLNHPDPNIQFFGAHTLQVKIARDW